MILLLLGLALAGVEFEPAPTVGNATVITVTDGPRAARGETVRVVHNPGTASAHERAIGITDARGRTTWTPEQAGTFQLKAGIATHRGRIPWASPPAESLILLFALLLSALGSCIVGFRRRSRKV